MKSGRSRTLLRASQTFPSPPEELHRLLLRWYSRSQRNLPWRKTRDPYRIWVSEVMLQQTRVDTVIPYYERFLRKFPTVERLAEAPVDDVLALWSGLGYYRRARMLHEGARFVSERGVSEQMDRFPRDALGLVEIPGVGPYTAGAVASIAFNERAPVVDGNVSRVFARLFAIRQDVRKGAGEKLVWRLAASLVPESSPGDWNQSLMELGATVCTPEQPQCSRCPIARHCQAYALGKTEALPVPTVKAKPKPWARAAILLERDHRLLFAKRRASLVFGGLWEPPMVDIAPSEPEPPPSLRRLAREDLTRRPAVAHVLSHRRMSVDVYVGQAKSKTVRALPFSADYTQIRFFTKAEWRKVAMSTLAKKVLRSGGFGV